MNISMDAFYFRYASFRLSLKKYFSRFLPKTQIKDLPHRQLQSGINLVPFSLYLRKEYIMALRDLDDYKDKPECIRSHLNLAVYSYLLKNGIRFYGDKE